MLFIGPGEDRKSSRVGGITVPFRELEDYLVNESQYKGRFKFFQLLGRNRASLLVCYLIAGFKIIFDSRYQIISLHCTFRSMLFFAPFLITAKLFLGKSYSLRKFAGNFDHLFDGANLVTKYILWQLMIRAQLIFFETKYLVDWALEKGISVAWWPNSRNPPLISFDPEIEAKISDGGQESIRPVLVFLGSVTEAKGVFILKALAKNLHDVDIIIYGAADTDVLKDLLEDATPNFSYKGSVNHSQVSKIIQDADALLLPTSWPSEGYPGVMIEAAQVGTPVICSHARGPKELLNAIVGLGWTANFESYSEIKRLLPQVISQGSYEERQKLVHRGNKFYTENVLPPLLSRIFKDGSPC